MSLRQKTKRQTSCFLSLFFLFPIIFLQMENRSEFPKKEKLQVSSWLDLGKKLIKQGEYNQSIEYFNNYLSHSLSKDQNTLESYLNLSILYWNIDRFKEATDCLKYAHELSSLLGQKKEFQICEKTLEIHRLFMKALEWREKGNLSQSNISFEKAVATAKSIQSPAHELKILRTWSANYVGDLNNNIYLDLNKRALSIAQSLKHKTEILNAALNIGSFYAIKNDYSRSLSYYAQAQEYAQAVKDNKSTAILLSNIAFAYISLNDYKRAFDYASEALKLSQPDSKPWRLALLFSNLGQIFQSHAHIAQTNEYYVHALECFEASYNLAQKAGNENLAQGALVNMAGIYADLNQLEKAKSILSPALEKAIKSNDTIVCGHILNILAMTSLRQKDYAKAEIYFQKALAEAQKSGTSTSVIGALYGLGRCREEAGDYSKAIDLYSRAIKIIEDIGSKILNDINQSEFIFYRREVYQRLINLDYELLAKSTSSIFEDDIYHNVERMKARSFIEYMERRSSSENLKPTTESISREEILKGERLNYLRLLSQNGLNQAKKEDLELKIRRTDDTLNAIFFNQFLQSKIPQAFMEPIAIGILQKKVLNPDTAIIEYFMGDDRSFLILITSTAYKVIALPSAKEIYLSIIAYITFLCDPNMASSKGIAGAQRIYKELLSPIESYISDSINHLIIVPDGILFSLPFETLILDQRNPSTYKYLISRFTISYSPSVSALYYFRRRDKKQIYPKEILAFGNPVYPKLVPSIKENLTSPSLILAEIYRRNGLIISPIPYSKIEVEEISKNIKAGKKDIYIGTKANEKTVKALNLTDYRIIHFACHAFSDEDNPLRLTLVLSLDNNDEEDNFLDVSEMYKMKISADLVVLSACQTGKGKSIRNEGILGLPRVFFYMGSHSVISTLWCIDDKAAAELMKYFYSFYFQGLGKAQALRSAKEKMMKSKYSHPFYWGAFILTGEE